MNNPQFKDCNVGAFNKKECLDDLRKVNFQSLVGLYISKALLFSGIVMLVLNNLNIIAPGKYFGSLSWVMVTVFAIGIILNFICIPFLYFSSLRDFEDESDFWDTETFWILPMFFFGTFFLYNAEFSLASTILIISIIVISLVHIRFIIQAQKSFKNGEFSAHINNGQYSVTLKYLTVYYVLLLTLLVFFNPLQHTFFWIRMNI